MNKTTYGFILVGGLLVCLASGVAVAIGSGDSHDVSKDWLYDTIKYSGIAGVLAGIGMFFFGAMKFSRG